MTTVAKDAKVVTLINVFTVTPDRPAQRDGRRVANYAQWESEGAFHSMLKNPEAQQHMKACLEIAEAFPVLYDVKSVFEK